MATSLTDDNTDEAVRQMTIRFGTNLKAARQSLNLTQEQLGETSGHGRVYVQRIESGQINVSLKTMVSLARAVSVAVEDLLRPGSETEGTLHIDNAIGSQVALSSGVLAIELPAGAAFEAGQVVARYLGKSVPLIDPATRTISGIAGMSVTPQGAKPTK